MTRADFDELLRRIEDRYRSAPEALERSTTTWVRLGQAVVAVWLLFLFLLTALAFVAGIMVDPPGGLVILAVGVAIGVYAIAQAGLFLLIDSPAPDGRLLRPGEAVELTALLGALQREMKCRPFHEVRLSMDFNAGVSEIPRLGIFGWPRTILDVGLPLLLILSAAEFRAVLAHEFVHLSARHGRGGARIHRLHLMWSTLFMTLQKPGSGSFRKAAHGAASAFVGWYWPRLQARSLALSRHHEHQADRIAAEIAGAESIISGLWRLQCRGPWLAECFWPNLHQQAVDTPEPPSDVLNRLRLALLTPASTGDAARWTERALSRRTVRDETHPAFFDRARALGLPDVEILALQFTADIPPIPAVTLLGADLEGLLLEQSAQWRAKERASWRERHRRASVEARRRRLPEPPASISRDAALSHSTSLIANGVSGVADVSQASPHVTDSSGTSVSHTAPVSEEIVQSPDEPTSDSDDIASLWASALETVTLRGPAAAEPLLRTVLKRSPAHPGASVLLGDHLLGRGDIEGERLLWTIASSTDEQWTPSACQALESHYRISGRSDLQRDARLRLDRHEAEVKHARAERVTVKPSDSFLPHALSSPALEHLHSLLAAQPDCAGAWLARKAVHYFPDRPLFILAVRSRPGRWGLLNRDRDTALVKSLVSKVHLPGQVLVVSRSSSFHTLARKIQSLPASQVFSAPSTPARS